MGKKVATTPPPPCPYVFASETHILCRQPSTVAAWAGKVELLFDPCHLSPEGRYLIHLFHLAKGWRQVSWWEKKNRWENGVVAFRNGVACPCFFGEEYPTQNVLMIDFRLSLGVNDFPAKTMNCFHEAHCTPKAHCLQKSFSNKSRHAIVERKRPEPRQPFVLWGQRMNHDCDPIRPSYCSKWAVQPITEKLVGKIYRYIVSYYYYSNLSETQQKDAQPPRSHHSFPPKNVSFISDFHPELPIAENRNKSGRDWWFDSLLLCTVDPSDAWPDAMTYRIPPPQK